jgi:hypothetical protein
MARLQILELPEGAADGRPPFVLVVDEWDVDTIEASTMLADYWDAFGKKIGARGVLFVDRRIDIPANDTSAYLARPAAKQELAVKLGAHDVREAIAADMQKLRDANDYGWRDHGVAPAWLTEGWTPHIDSREHLKQMAEFDEAITRVRAMSTEPEVMNAEQERPDIWLHGYKSGVLAAKSMLRPRGEETAKP